MRGHSGRLLVRDRPENFKPFMIYVIAAGSLVFLTYLVLEFVREQQRQRIALAYVKKRRAASLARH
jgi:hypothetical protein